MIPAEAYMIKGGNKTAFRQIQPGIHSVCIQQGETVFKQHIYCYCDTFLSDFFFKFLLFYYHCDTFKIWAYVKTMDANMSVSTHEM